MGPNPLWSFFPLLPDHQKFAVTYSHSSLLLIAPGEHVHYSTETLQFFAGQKPQRALTACAGRFWRIL